MFDSALLKIDSISFYRTTPERTPNVENAIALLEFRWYIATQREGFRQFLVCRATRADEEYFFGYGDSGWLKFGERFVGIWEFLIFKGWRMICARNISLVMGIWGG